MKKTDAHQYNHIGLSKIDLWIWRITLIVLIIGSCIFYFTYRSTYDSALRFAEISTEKMAGSIAENIEATIDKEFYVLDYLATLPEINEMDRVKQKEYLDGKGKVLGFDYFFIIDKEGFGYYFDEGVVRNQKDEPFFEWVMENERYVSDPFIHSDARSPIITLSTSIYNNGEKIGVLCATVSLDIVYESIKEKLDDYGYLSVVTSTGQYVADKNISLVRFKENISDTYKYSHEALDFIDRALNSEGNYTDIVKYKGTNYCVSAIDTKYADWKLFMAIDRKYVIQGINKVSILQLFSFITIFAMLILIRYVRLNSLKKEKATFTDKLTQIANTAKCQDVMQNFDLINSVDVMIVCFDLNDFKHINDSYGHLIGDLALKDFAKALKDTYGKVGFVGRMGGDEFMALLSDDCDEKYKKCKEQLQALVDELNNRQNFQYKISYACGKALREVGSCRSIYDLYRYADKTMYIDKKEQKEKKVIK